MYALIRNAKLMTMSHCYREQHPLHSLGNWIPPQTVHLLPGSCPPHDLGTEGVPRDWPNYPLRWGICCLLYSHVLLSYSNVVASTCVHLFKLWLFWKCTVYAKIFKFCNLSELKNLPVLLIFPSTSLTNKTNLVILKCTSKTNEIWGKQVISLLCT